MEDIITPLTVEDESSVPPPVDISEIPDNSLPDIKPESSHYRLFRTDRLKRFSPNARKRLITRIIAGEKYASAETIIVLADGELLDIYEAVSENRDKEIRKSNFNSDKLATLEHNTLRCLYALISRGLVAY